MSGLQPILSPDEYRTLVEQSPILIWRSGLDGRCDYFNERWLAFTGRSLAQELGDGWAEGVHPEDLARCLDIYVSHFDRREVFEMEYRLRRHDGAWRWILDRGAPFLDEQGRFAGFIGSCVDVTERVEARQALVRANETLLEDLRGLLPVCMLCRNVRNERGDWEPLDHYVAAHSRMDLSHGICPDCLPGYQATMKAELRQGRQGAQEG